MERDLYLGRADDPGEPHHSVDYTRDDPIRELVKSRFGGEMPRLHGFDLNDTEELYRFPDDYFRGTYASHILEHVRPRVYDELIVELARITRDCILVTGPHFLSWNAEAADHHRSFSRRSFDVYDRGHDFPTQKPTVFDGIDYWYTLRDTRTIRMAEKAINREWVVENIPNAVKEIHFWLEVI